jgi:hypothetical protein
VAAALPSHPSAATPMVSFFVDSFHFCCLAPDDSDFKGFFGWGYEDHELLWRVEESGGEPGRQHWGYGRCVTLPGSSTYGF